MNDEVKEILIDLVEYYSAIGTENDPGIQAFESVAQRASKALERYATNNNKKSVDVDPFIGYDGQQYGGFPEAPIKHEDEL